MGKLKDQLAGVAALGAAIIAIGGGFIKYGEITTKLDALEAASMEVDKVDADVKDIAKNLQIKNIIKLDAMASEQASLDLYRNAIFYKPKDIYLDQLNIFDPRQIYPNVSLASYVNNDKIAIKAKALEKLKLEKRRLQIELEQLKNG